MIGFLVVGLIVVLGIATVLGWTSDGRNDVHKLWPLDRNRSNAPCSTYGSS